MGKSQQGRAPRVFINRVVVFASSGKAMDAATPCNTFSGATKRTSRESRGVAMAAGRNAVWGRPGADEILEPS